MRFGSTHCGVVALFCAISMVLAGPVALAKPPAKHGPRHVKQAHPKLTSPFDDLTQLPNGNGAVVFDPVATSASPDLAAFGAGCSRWLHLAVGGQGELGRSPGWSSVDDARDQLRLADLRVTSTDGCRAVKLLGATHAVVGELSGAAGMLTLSYQIYAAGATPAAVGTPIKLAGTEAQVIAALPGAAEQIARALGVATPRVLQVHTDADGLRFLGSLPQTPDDGISDDEIAKLVALAQTEPLAAVMLAVAPRLPVPGVAAKAAQCVKSFAPANVIACSELARHRDLPAGMLTAEVKALTAAFPTNRLLLLDRLAAAEGTPDFSARIAIAKQLVRSAPRYPRYWILLGESFYEAANSIRFGRTIGDMSKAERAKVFAFYPYWVAASLRAVELNPKSTDALMALAHSACFDGGDDIAMRAFQAALHNDPGSADVISWGLEMLQPKWLGDEDALGKFIVTAAEAPYTNPMGGMEVARQLRGINRDYAVGAERIEKRMLDVARTYLAAHPGSPIRREALAQVCWANQKYKEALSLYTELARRYPSEKRYAERVSEYTVNSDDRPEALDNLLRMDRAGHGTVKTKIELAFKLEDAKRWAEAEAVLQSALKIASDKAEVLADLEVFYRLQKRWPEAAAAQRKVAALRPKWDNEWGLLMEDLAEGGKLDEALAAGREGLKACGESGDLHEDLAKVLKQKGDLPGALAQLHRAIKLAPRNYGYKQDLAGLLDAQGDRTGAEAAWADTLRLADASPDARMFRLYYAQQLIAWNRKPEAIEILKKIIEGAKNDQAGNSATGELVRLGVMQREGADLMAIQRVFEQLHGDDGPKRVELFRKAAAEYPQSAAIRCQLAFSLMIQTPRNYADAEAAYRDAIRVDPHDSGGWYGLGQVYREQQKYDQAIDDYRTATEIDPRDGNAWNGYIGTLIDVGRKEQALTAALACLQVDPNGWYVHKFAAQVLQDAGRLAEAVDHWRLFHLPSRDIDVEAHTEIGRCLWVLGKKAEATEQWNAALAGNPGDYWGPRIKKLLAEGCTQRDLVLPAPKVAPPSAGGPATADTWAAEADTLWRRGDRAAAIDAYRKALKLDPKLTKAHKGLGLACFFNQQPAEAEAEMRTVLRVTPDDPVASFWLGSALCVQNKPVEALPFLRKAVAAVPTEAQYHAQYVTALINSRRFGEAVAAARAAVAALPKLWTVRIHLADALEKAGDNDGAVAEYRKCMEGLQPRDTSYIREQLAQFYTRIGDNTSALAELRKSLDGVTDRTRLASVHMQIGWTLSRSNKPDEARAEWQTAADLDPTGPYAAQAKAQLAPK